MVIIIIINNLVVMGPWRCIFVHVVH